MQIEPAHHILTRQQVRAVDRITTERFGLPGIVLMENASRGAVAAIIANGLPHASALILCGGGNNGGDGLAIARHFHNAGSAVTIGLCTDPGKYSGDAAINWRVVQAMKLPTMDATPEALESSLRRHPPDLLVDAIFGTGLTQPPRDPFGEIADVVERSGISVAAIDLPSGLDCDTGLPLGAKAIKAVMTVTFAGMKKGLLAAAAAAYSGRVYVADIGCPREAIAAAMALRGQL